MADAPQKTTSGAGTAKQTKGNAGSSATPTAPTTGPTPATGGVPTTGAAPTEVVIPRAAAAKAAAQQSVPQGTTPKEATTKQTPTRRPVPRKAPPSRKAASQQTAPKPPAASEAAPAVISPQAQEEGRVQLQAFVEANEAIMTSMATLSSEMVAFGTKRLAENIERNHTLLGCEEPEQIMRVQNEFVGQATKQYLDQVNTVINLVNDMTRAMWEPFGVSVQESSIKQKSSDD